MPHVFRAVLCEQLSDERQGLPEMQAPGQVGFEPHVWPPDIVPEFPIECAFRKEMLSVSLRDLCFFRNRHHRFEDDAVQTRVERHNLLPWRIDAYQHLPESGSDGLVPNPDHSLSPPDFMAGHLPNGLQNRGGDNNAPAPHILNSPGEAEYFYPVGH